MLQNDEKNTTNCPDPPQAVFKVHKLPGLYCTHSQWVALKTLGYNTERALQLGGYIESFQEDHTKYGITQDSQSPETAGALEHVDSVSNWLPKAP